MADDVGVRRRTGIALLALALLAAAAPVRADAPKGGTAVGVGEREFTISPYRTKVPKGLVRFNVTNFGEDGHNLTVVRASDGATIAASPEIGASKRYTLRVTLKRAGTYRLYCTIAGHKRLGMKTKISVT
jgi:plastocyanin